MRSQNLEGFTVGEEWIEKLQVLGRHGKLAKAHFSVSGGGDGGAGCLDAARVEPAIATFLMGAGANAFFSCAKGWTGIGQGGGVEPWVSWLPQYDQPLGKPLGLGTKGPDGVWRRNFSSGTAVWFDAATDATQICWGGRGAGGLACPQFAPPPPPSPPAPAPPTPASCGAVRRDTGVGGHGSDLWSLEKRVGSAAECCAWCEAHKDTSSSLGPHLGELQLQEQEQGGGGGCVFWAWHAEQGNSCHLHNGRGEFTQKRGCYSGQPLNSSVPTASPPRDDVRQAFPTFAVHFG
jgi:hypothetical protein